LIPGDHCMSQKPTYEEFVQRIHHLETKIKKCALDSDVGGSTSGKLEDFKDPKRSEESTRDAKKMLQLVMDNIPQFIFWKDRNSVYLGCNQNFARIAGVGQPEKIRGKTDYDLPWKKEEADFFRECDRRVMDNDCPEYHIIEPQFQAGSRQAWVDTNKIPLHDHEGNVVGILGTLFKAHQKIPSYDFAKLQKTGLCEKA
jgi:PAS domain S-box-containing protein